jgi:hypothetical protein
MRINIKSLLPSHISSGYLRYNHTDHHLYSSLCTPNGEIALRLPYDGLAFLQKTHLTTSRGGKNSLVSESEIKAKINRKYLQSLNDLSIVMQDTADDEEVSHVLPRCPL